MTQQWAICDDCGDPYPTVVWGWPFICNVCSYNQVQADALIRFQTMRKQLREAV